MGNTKKNRAKGKTKDKTTVTRVNGIPIRHLGPERFMVDARAIISESIEVEGETLLPRQSFKTLDEAKAYAEQLTITRMNKGLEGFTLSNRQRRDALDALAVLGEGVTLLEAAREYRRRYPDQSAEKLSETVEKLIADMRKEGRREISIKEAARKWKMFMADHPDMATCSLDRKDIDEWVRKRKWQGVTARNYRNAMLTLLNFYHGTMRKKRRREDQPVEVWGVSTVKKLFEASAKHTPEIVPAFAVMFFCGTRPYEALRLTWEQINLKEGHIRLEGEQVKTASSRVIEMPDNAIAWLARYQGSGLLIESGAWYRKHREKAMKHAGIEKWPKDVSRHTYASCLYAERKDPGYVATQLGHWEGLDMLKRHYYAVVTEKDAKEYFSIKPKAGKVIKLRAQTA